MPRPRRILDDDELLAPLPPIDDDDGAAAPPPIELPGFADDAAETPVAGDDAEADDLGASELTTNETDRWSDDDVAEAGADEGEPSELAISDELSSWVDDAATAHDAADEVLGVDEPDIDAHDDADGPVQDLVHDLDIDTSDRDGLTSTSGGDDADADGAHEGHTVMGDAVPAITLARGPAVRHTWVEAPGAVLSAAANDERVLLCGDALAELPVSSALRAHAKTVAARRIDVPASEWLTSVAFLGARRWLAASMEGRVSRSDDDGATWDAVAALGAQDSGSAAIELYADPTRGDRAWARAHGGGLFRSDDGGRSWEGPVMVQPVRAFAVDAASGDAFVITSAWSAELLRSADGREWRALPAKLPTRVEAMAVMSDVCVCALGAAPAVVTRDAGRTWHAWPVLSGATALALVQTDDGAIDVIAGVWDEAGDRSVLVSANVGADGQPAHATRIADLDDLLPPVANAASDDVESRVDVVLALDRPGRRLLVVTPRGTLVISRDPD